MVVLVMPLFVYIPMPCIASILITASCNLIPVKVIRALWRVDKGDLGILLFTFAVCVLEDGAIGLVLGACVALLRVAVSTGNAIIDTIHDEGFSGNRLDVLVLKKHDMTYLVALDTESELLARFKAYKAAGEVKYVVLDFSEMELLDLDGLQVL